MRNGGGRRRVSAGGGIVTGGPVRPSRLAAVAAALAAAAFLSAAAPTAAAPTTAAPGVTSGTAAGIWSASLQGVHGVAPDATVRVIARASVAGTGLRVRLGNPFGSTPVRVRDAW